MARRKRKEEDGGNPPWLITFSDLMTLLLTFFVMLVSMSTVDEMRRLEVLTTVTGAFGFGTAFSNPIARTQSNQNVEPGPMDIDETSGDMEALKDMLWEDLGRDVNFLSNKYVQILSISTDVLFERGSSVLTMEGMRLLDAMLPVLLRLKYPLLIGGHTSNERDEEGEEFLPADQEKALSSSWMLSFMRCASVYNYLKSKNMPASMLSLEAFGRYRPRYPDKTARERRANRRVDLVLDKRTSPTDANLLNRLKGDEQKNDTYQYKEFIFKLPGDAKRRQDNAGNSIPAPEEPANAPEASGWRNVQQRRDLSY